MANIEKLLRARILGINIPIMMNTPDRNSKEHPIMYIMAVAVKAEGISFATRKGIQIIKIIVHTYSILYINIITKICSLYR